MKSKIDLPAIAKRSKLIDEWKLDEIRQGLSIIILKCIQTLIKQYPPQMKDIKSDGSNNDTNIAKEDNKYPLNWYCMLSNQIMSDPVKLSCKNHKFDMQIFERSVIEKYLKNENTTDYNLLSQRKLKKEIQNYITQYDIQSFVCFFYFMPL